MPRFLLLFVLFCFLASLSGCATVFGPKKLTVEDCLCDVVEIQDPLKRLEQTTERLLGSDYKEFGLGQGARAKYDKRPLYDFSSFDCTTFVEQVTAITLANNKKGFIENLEAIRFRGGKRNFVYGNHFISLDWIPNNIRNGIYRDITQWVLQKRNPKVAIAEIDKRTWFERLPLGRIHLPKASMADKKQMLEELRAEGKRFRKKKVRLPYISMSTLLPKVKKATASEVLERKKEHDAYIQKREAELVKARLEKIKPNVYKRFLENQKAKIRKHKRKLSLRDHKINTDLLKRIPHASVVSVVAPNWDLKKEIGTPLNISHQGFAIRKEGKLYMRHASSKAKKVIDEEMGSFLKRMYTLKHVDGIHLLAISRILKKD